MRINMLSLLSGMGYLICIIKGIYSHKCENVCQIPLGIFHDLLPHVYILSILQRYWNSLFPDTSYANSFSHNRFHIWLPIAQHIFVIFFNIYKSHTINASLEIIHFTHHKIMQSSTTSNCKIFHPPKKNLILAFTLC